MFLLLKKTDAMSKEMSEASVRGIDLEKESIKIGGRKGHASRAIKLKPNMIEMLKT
jgi:hypothetical protein